MKKRWIKIILLMLVVVWGLGGDGLQAGMFEVNGYYKFFFTGFELPAYQYNGETVEQPPMGAVNNRLRLKGFFRPAHWISVEAAYDFSPRIQDPLLFDQGLFVTGIDPGTYRVGDLSDCLYPRSGAQTGSLGVFHNLDRLFVTLKTPIADIFIGRQAIAWGSGRFVNPTDVIAPFTFNELDTEERQGVDAIRIRVPLGMMDELDMGYIPGRDFKFRNSAFYLRGKTYVLKTDLSLLFMGFRENLLIGLDVSRSIGGAGAWVEAAWVDPDFFKKSMMVGGVEDLECVYNYDWRKSYFRASVGMDYNFSGAFYGFAEYHYSSAGRSGPPQYNEVLMGTAFTEGAVYLMGRHYVNLGLTLQVTPLISGTAVAFVNVSDGSVTVSPAVEYNIAENIYLGAGAYVGMGKGETEFGAYPAMLYTSFRVYF